MTSLLNNSLPGFYLQRLRQGCPLGELLDQPGLCPTSGEGAARKQLQQDLHDNRSRLDRLLQRYKIDRSPLADDRQAVRCVQVYAGEPIGPPATHLLQTIADQGDTPELIARLTSQVYPAFSTALAAVKTVSIGTRTTRIDAAQTASVAVAGASWICLRASWPRLVLAFAVRVLPAAGDHSGRSAAARASWT